jgi:hypothetical protein
MRSMNGWLGVTLGSSNTFTMGEVLGISPGAQLLNPSTIDPLTMGPEPHVNKHWSRHFFQVAQFICTNSFKFYYIDITWIQLFVLVHTHILCYLCSIIWKPQVWQEGMKKSVRYKKDLLAHSWSNPVQQGRRLQVNLWPKHELGFICMDLSDVRQQKVETWDMGHISLAFLDMASCWKRTEDWELIQGVTLFS